MALLKWGVNPFFGHHILRVISRLDSVHQRVVGREMIITSANDGKHGRNSLHYKDRAIDIRTRDLPHEKITALAAALQMELGDDWDVVVEKTHIHVEFDPKI